MHGRLTHASKQQVPSSLSNVIVSKFFYSVTANKEAKYSARDRKRILCPLTSVSKHNQMSLYLNGKGRQWGPSSSSGPSRILNVFVFVCLKKARANDSTVRIIFSSSNLREQKIFFQHGCDGPNLIVGLFSLNLIQHLDNR